MLQDNCSSDFKSLYEIPYLENTPKQAISNCLSLQFNFYKVDFNDNLSALWNHLEELQTKYLCLCLTSRVWSHCSWL